jgi:hypothetical protein
MGEVTRKKKFGIVVVVLMLLVPLFMASNWGLGMLEHIALNHAQKQMASNQAPANWAASLDLGVADFYGVSLRVDKQKEVCERFLQTFKSHPRRGYAKFCIATCIERDTHAAKHHAIEAYEEFVGEYADDANSREYVEEAQRILVRLKNS